MISTQQSGLLEGLSAMRSSSPRFRARILQGAKPSLLSAKKDQRDSGLVGDRRRQGQGQGRTSRRRLTSHCQPKPSIIERERKVERQGEKKTCGLAMEKMAHGYRLRIQHPTCNIRVAGLVGLAAAVGAGGMRWASLLDEECTGRGQQSSVFVSLSNTTLSSAVVKFLSTQVPQRTRIDHGSWTIV
ncbi:hypothetical protein BDW66DRAFT_116027 [Aspergillus desertorum]